MINGSSASYSRAVYLRPWPDIPRPTVDRLSSPLCATLGSPALQPQSQAGEQGHERRAVHLFQGANLESNVVDAEPESAAGGCLRHNGRAVLLRADVFLTSTEGEDQSSISRFRSTDTDRYAIVDFDHGS